MSAVAAAAGGVAEGLVTSAFNAWQADVNRDFQRDMANTAHQREVRDLRKAGLNPILSARHGGAATPPGATATAGEFSPTARAIQSQQAKAQLQVAAATEKDLNSAAALKDAQTQDLRYTQEERLQVLKAEYFQKMSSGQLNHQQVRNLQKEIQRIDYQIEQIRLQNAHSSLDMDRAKRESEFFRGKAGPIGIMRKHLGVIGTGLGVGSAFEEAVNRTPTPRRDSKSFYNADSWLPRPKVPKGWGKRNK